MRFAGPLRSCPDSQGVQRQATHDPCGCSFEVRFGHGANARENMMLQSVASPIRLSFSAAKADLADGRPMPVGLPVAFLLFTQAATAAPSAGAHEAAYGPVAAAPAKPQAPPSDQAQRECAPQNKDPNAKEIVVCAVKPEGYRLPPDIVEARRLKKEGVTVRPRSPHESFADHSCANVGPMGCRGTPTLNMLAVAAVAAEISKRMAKGQEIGSLFETQKSSTDYQYYQMAKKNRQEREDAALAKAAKAKAVAAPKSAAVGQQQSAQAPTGGVTPATENAAAIGNPATGGNLPQASTAH